MHLVVLEQSAHSYTSYYHLHQASACAFSFRMSSGHRHFMIFMQCRYLCTLCTCEQRLRGFLLHELILATLQYMT